MGSLGLDDIPQHLYDLQLGGIEGTSRRHGSGEGKGVRGKDREAQGPALDHLVGLDTPVQRDLVFVLHCGTPPSKWLYRPCPWMRSALSTAGQQGKEAEPRGNLFFGPFWRKIG